MKVLLFGTGYFYRAYHHWFKDEDIVALLDNDAAKQGQVLDGHRVVAPADGVKLDYEAVFILSMYERDMREQLLTLGVPRNRIFGVFDIGRFVQGNGENARVQKFPAVRRNDTGKVRIAILSADLRRNGASVAAVYAAQALREQYDVTVITPTDGPLRQTLTEAGIEVWMAPVLQVAKQADVPWLQEFRLFFCNTFIWYAFLSRRDVRQPVIWWLHDAACFYDMVDNSVLRQIDLHNLYIMSVGPQPGEALRRFLPQAEEKDLLYGLPDACPQVYQPQIGEQVRFATVGMVQSHKGQDLLLDAIACMPAHWRQRAEFYLVGDTDSALAKELHVRLIDFPEVQMTGEMSREDLLHFYEQIDVLVCPSRADPMPIVATEAMMFSHPCIISDQVGTGKYLHQGEDGIIYPVQDVEALAEAMVNFIAQPQLIATMGSRARKVYERIFAWPIFEHNIRQCVTEALND